MMRRRTILIGDKDHPRTKKEEMATATVADAAALVTGDVYKEPGRIVVEHIREAVGAPFRFVRVDLSAELREHVEWAKSRPRRVRRKGDGVESKRSWVKRKQAEILERLESEARHTMREWPMAHGAPMRLVVEHAFDGVFEAYWATKV